MDVKGCTSCAQLEKALVTRDVIGTAKGLLMERFGISGEQAWRMLVRLSQSTNTKLSMVAQRMVDEHDQACQ